jgi:EpsI family protein
MNEFLTNLKRPAQLAVTVVLLAQIALFYAIPTAEQVPLSLPLSEVPREINGWVTTQEIALDEETANLLKADDTVNRYYRSPDGETASLFIAWFKSQRQGASPHSPKVCLPGSGWEQISSEIIQVPMPEINTTESINRYTVAKGNARSVVMYWYQSHGRLVADEYQAKLLSMYDSVRFRRSDTSIVRLVVPTGEDETNGRLVGMKFLKDVFPTVWNFLPGKELRK